MRDPLQVFEHDVVRVGEGGLTLGHFDALVKFNQRHGDRFFTVRHKALRFGSHVGVLQIGRLTIEVLPKTDREGIEDKNLWRNALVGMLRYCGYLKARLPTWAELHLQRTSLLDLYLEAFFSEADEIVRHGLAKRYRRSRGDLASLKGRLVFGEHIARNLVHKERFYTDHDKYDWDNDFNRILKRATAITSVVATTSTIRSQAAYLSHSFETVSDEPIVEASFDRLRYDRKTEQYRRAIALARLIILNYQPDVRAGGQNVLAILCDMNDLFEQYVFRRVRQAAAKKSGIEVRGQKSHPFWRSDGVARHIRPDIEVRLAGCVAPVVLDTKWKVPNEPYPSDGDLKQMFAYGERLRTSRSLLVYPRTDDRQDIVGLFEETDQGRARKCDMLFIDLFEGGRLRPDLGDAILARL
jgi:5-methylcytosine-specific restriction enzyme subunit McrC